MLSITVTCCTNVHILIRCPLKMKFLHPLWKFHGYIFNGLAEKQPPAILPVDLKGSSHKMVKNCFFVSYILYLSLFKN